MIDPQSQANKWIKSMEKENKINVIKLSNPKFLKIIEDSIRNGLPVLLENIEETLGLMRNQVTRITESNMSPEEKETRIREIKLREQRMLKNQEAYLKHVRTEALQRPEGLL